MEEEDDAISISRSQSPSQSQYDSLSPPPPPSPLSAPPVTVAAAAASSLSAPSLSLNGGRITDLVTVAAHSPPVGVPIQQPRTAYGAGAGGGGSGGREDCWSDGATSTLIDAWGERYLELSRGSLKQKQWQEVADAVISRDGYTKTPKTDVQCKNRIDTLKKKYKNEKAKIAAAGGGAAAAASPWPFFHRLDVLLGHSTQKAAPDPARQPQTAAPSRKIIPEGVPIRQSTQFPQRQRTKKMNPSPPSAAASKSDDSSADSSEGLPPATLANSKKGQSEGAANEEPRIASLRELTQAILRFGEVYERVESSKLQQAMEMEKQRMSFSKELEVQRMQFFMKTQMELSQLKTTQPMGSKKKRRMDDGSKNNAGNSTSHRHHRNNGGNSNNSDHIG